MSFSDKSLARTGVQVPVGSTGGAAQSNQVSQYLYASDDAFATIETAGYFNNARARLNKGDTIDAVGAVSGTPIRKTLVVTAVPAAPGNITVAIQQATAG